MSHDNSSNEREVDPLYVMLSVAMESEQNSTGEECNGISIGDQRKVITALCGENASLMADNAELIAGNIALSDENDMLVAENDRLRAEIDALRCRADALRCKKCPHRVENTIAKNGTKVPPLRQVFRFERDSEGEWCKVLVGHYRYQSEIPPGFRACGYCHYALEEIFFANDCKRKSRCIYCPPVPCESSKQAMADLKDRLVENGMAPEDIRSLKLRIQ